MKKFYLLLLIFINTLNLFADDILLRYWKDDDKIAAFDHQQFAYDWQFQRFDISAPCKLKSTTIYLLGETSIVDVVILGQQGGNSIPFVFSATGKNILASTQIQFQGSTEPVPINLTFDTPIEFDGDQCFVGVRIDNVEKTKFLTGLTEVPPSCQTKEGDKYGYQYLLNITDTNKVWATANFSYLCNLIVEYTYSGSKAYLTDRTLSEGISPNMSVTSVAWGDVNNDDYLDVLVNGRLFINQGKGSGFKETTSKAGLSGSPSANGFIDFDNDGDLDIIFLNSDTLGTTLSKLYINDGSGNFTSKDINLPGFRGVSAFSIADVNNDKYPDIFVAQSWSSTPQFPLQNYLLLNNKNNTFTIKGGVCQSPTSRRTLGTQFVDFDDDGDLDLYVSNYYQDWDELWENKGDLVFTNVIQAKAIDILTYNGKNYSNWGVGVDWYDYDNDGDMDLMLPQYCPANLLPLGFQGTTIYNNKNANFTNTWDQQLGASGLGIEFEETQSGGAWGDFNNDGLADLIFTTDYGCRYIDLYKQLPNHHFQNVTYEWGLNRIVTGDDAIWVDYDNDGRLDLSMSLDRKYKLFKNTANTENNWVEIDLRSEETNYFAIGAKVKVYAGGKIYAQEVNAGRGRGMQKPARLHFGLGTDDFIDKVEVRWPGSKTYITYNDIKANQINKIIQKSVSVEELSNNIEKSSLEITGANPLNDVLQFSFKLVSSDYVDISIYDLQGKLVQNVYSNYISGGKYNFNTNTTNLNSGYYILKLSSNKFSSQKAFIIQR
ncbi:MAG: FG-GAP-like repeat-containing protein [Candidatus Kapaibacteriota bacterium]